MCIRDSFQFTGIQAPAPFSVATLFSEFDMREENAEQYSHSIEVTATKTGVINSLRLTSPLVLFDDITFSSSDSLMPPVVVPLKNDINVKKGDKLRVFVDYTTNTSWEGFKAWVEPTNQRA